MGVVIIIGLIVAVASLWWVSAQQSKQIEQYEQELTKKARKRKK